jgi:Zn-dependent protease with chaperone function
MNFFEYQDKARRSTKRLVFFFILAVLSLIVLADLGITALLLATSNTYRSMGDIPLSVHATVFFSIAVIVLLASLYRFNQLRHGGYTVARALGARRIAPDSDDFYEKRLLNVVEEMAIASGTPVPPVYLVDDSAINAFAAGYSQQDAVIGITRGAIEMLDRDELQGVVAHEFSHIFNGDMRLNLQLLGLLFGILFVGLIGRRMIESGARSRDGVVFIITGLGVMIVGYSGIIFGNLIKAAVSRQREYLADASAVQYTRNPDGIGGALKKIGGWAVGSRLGVPNAAEFSHFYIAQGIGS